MVNRRYSAIMILGPDDVVIKSAQFPTTRSDIMGDYVEIINDTTHHYFYNGRLHRDNGPASYSKEYQAWFRNGELHKDDGPAFIFLIDIPNANKRYFFIRGEEITDDVECWIIQSNYMPEDHEQWTAAHKSLFKLTFGQ